MSSYLSTKSVSSEYIILSYLSTESEVSEYHVNSTDFAEQRSIQEREGHRQQPCSGLVQQIQRVYKSQMDRSSKFRHCGLVVSAPAWDGTGCEFDSWQCRIYIPCSLSLRLLGSLRVFSGYIWLETKIVLKKQWVSPDNERGRICSYTAST